MTEVNERMRQYRQRKAAGLSKSVQRMDWRADDIDHVVIERVLAGNKPGRPLHPRELTEIARVLASQGLGMSALAKLTKCNTSTAQRLMGEVST